MSKADASAQVQAWVEAGHAVALQAVVTGGYIRYEFIGGTYDGVTMRLYPPFTERLRFLDEFYFLGPPKNGRSKRLTYRLGEPMVQIRSLRTLKLPSSPKGYRPRPNIVVVRRTHADFPSPTPQSTPCRLWQGAQGSDGYGWRKLEGKPISMHRWVMMQVLGRKLRPNEIVLHACDNPLCYREAHLSIGTVRSNNDDMRAKGRATPPPVNVFHGEAHPMAKLQEWQVRRIRGHRQSGLSVKTIAAMFEISPSTVRRICRGVTWNYVGDNTTNMKPPTRDLLAEARAKIEAENAEAAAQLAASQARQLAAPKRNTRVKPVKPLNIRRNHPT